MTPKLAQRIPNKFQELIESPDIHLYGQKERAQKSVALNDTDLKSSILEKILDASRQHVHARQHCIRERVKSNESCELTTEALFDSHFRKQRNFGPTRESVRLKVRGAENNREPIELVALMFTRKNVCLLKSSGADTSMPDLAEVISLIHLNSYAELLSKFHPYGVRFTLLSEGTRFLKAFHLKETDVRTYQSRLHKWISELDLPHLTLWDYEDFLSNQLGPSQWKTRASAYKDSLAQYEACMSPLVDTNNMNEALAKAIVRDPVKDSHNARNNFVPLWDSIKHSLPYSEISNVADELGIEYESLYREIFSNLLVKSADKKLEDLRCTVLKKSWAAAIEHNARILGDVASGIDVASLISRFAFRTTINPKPNSSHLGIYSVRETTSRVQPWHGMAYVEIDGIGRLKTTVLTKLELEARGAHPVLVGEGTNAFFYASPQAAELIRRKLFPIATMNTR